MTDYGSEIVSLAERLCDVCSFPDCDRLAHRTCEGCEARMCHNHVYDGEGEGAERGVTGYCADCDMVIQNERGGREI